MDGLRGPGTLRDVTIATTMSTLVGLELWTDQIGPQTTEQVDGMEGAVGFDAIGWAGGRALLVCSMIHRSAFLDAIPTEIPLPTRPKPSSRPISVVIEMVEPGAFAPLAMDSASLELTHRLMILSEGRAIPAGCVGAQMMPCVEGIGLGHVRPLQSNEAFACLVGLAVGAVGLATAHGTCQNGVAKARLPSACCP